MEERVRDIPTESPIAPPREATLLLVDDEQNILSSLRRVFRGEGYRVLTATGGAGGLEILEREPVDLVISDMRMPEMDGAQFLETVATRWPDTVRILLTGYADLCSTVAAINKGHIYSYISKPWEDNDLKLTVRRALERKRLEEERRRLLELTRRQNEELRALNADLEAKIQARTEELRQTVAFLEMAYEELKKSYQEAIPVFASLVELRLGISAGHGQRVAQLAERIARELGLDDEEVQQVHNAGLLHDIGKIGLRDELIKTPYNALGPEDRAEVHTHAVLGQTALMSLKPLERAARYVRAHHERFDGRGYPDGLVGHQIPLGGRILAVANDFDGLQNGSLLGEPLSASEARAFIAKNRMRRYDPEVVDAFLRVLEKSGEHFKYVSELRLPSDDLQDGMELTRDLITRDGKLLLAKGHRLTDALIEKIRDYERGIGHHFLVHVRVEQEDRHVPDHAGG